MTLSRPDDFDAEKFPLHDKKRGLDDSKPNQATQDQLKVEFSDTQESPIPLEVPRVGNIISNPASLSSQPTSESIASAPEVNQPNEIVIPLLEERLIVERRKRKVAEVVVRKEIETQIVEVPIRREKLIVEQISPEYKQIAVVELGQAQMTDLDTVETVDVTHSQTVSGEFTSIREAIQFLTAIATDSNSGLQKVQMKVVLDNPAMQATYQRWLEQYTT